MTDVGGAVRPWRFPAITFAVRLQLARDDAGLTQAELAERSLISERSIARYEAGEGMPGRLRLQSLARALDTSELWLLTGETDGPDGAEQAIPPSRCTVTRRVA